MMSLLTQSCLLVILEHHKFPQSFYSFNISLLLQPSRFRSRAGLGQDGSEVRHRVNGHFQNPCWPHPAPKGWVPLEWRCNSEKKCWSARDRAIIEHNFEKSELEKSLALEKLLNQGARLLQQAGGMLHQQQDDGELAGIHRGRGEESRNIGAKRTGDSRSEE